MKSFTFDPSAQRISRARYARSFTPGVLSAMQMLAFFLAVVGIIFAALGLSVSLSLLGGAITIGCYLTWLRHGLLMSGAAPFGDTTELSSSLPWNLVANYSPKLSANQLFELAASSWDGQFILERFQLPISECQAVLTTEPLVHQDIWAASEQIIQESDQGLLTNAVIISAYFATVPKLGQLLTAQKLKLDDLYAGVNWAARLGNYQAAKKPLYGGVARDWAAGFTPLLDRFGISLSHQVEFAGKYFKLEERTSQLDTLIAQLNSPSGSTILIGEPGIGKSALLLGLADRILQGVESGRLAHQQIYSLNASSLIAEASSVGSIEQVVLSTLNEAIRAQNIIVALDEAQLFFGQGAGAVNLSQVLLPYLQSRSITLVLAVTPGDWQKLKATNQGLTSLLNPLILSEPNQATTLAMLADRSLLMESPAGVVVTYEALGEAYRLSGRYVQEEAYPGRALKVLESGVNHPQNGYITAVSIQEAIEAQFGVKVGTASAAESDVLLGMEDKIHERMINQRRAVSVVANALRRARAGVSNPKRPIGSFLFLGPTGVGKTELARSLAAVYFGNENNIIRLDMSEYQQIADVDRILQDASLNPEGLLPLLRATPFSVVLFDEIEKAHPNVLNLFLQLLDEGSLTDLASRPVSFKDAIIIATSNAGAEEIRKRIDAGEELSSFEQQFIDDLINSGQFRPELLNRFDEIVLFRPLKPDELAQVVGLMIKEVNATLEPQQITVELTAEAIANLVQQGYDPRLGARPMRRMVTRKVEDAVAGQILRGEVQPGDTITLDVQHLAGQVTPTDN